MHDIDCTIIRMFRTAQHRSPVPATNPQCHSCNVTVNSQGRVIKRLHYWPCNVPVSGVSSSRHHSKSWEFRKSKLTDQSACGVQQASLNSLACQITDYCAVHIWFAMQLFFFFLFLSVVRYCSFWQAMHLVKHNV